VRQTRDEWKGLRQPRMRQQIHRLVFLDETGTTTKMTRLRGRARRGARLKADAPFGHWATQTFIAGLRCDGLTAPWVIDQPMNRQIFDTYIETQLAPTLQPGDVVILDNLASHKSAKAELSSSSGAVPLPAALQSRPQSDRNGLRKAQGPPQTDRREDYRCPLESHR
jgi:DDE superfamily endonuclease